jgi:Ca2+-binding RTX toxin-like protein
VVLSTGVVNAASGTDSLLSIEGIRGTNEIDTFDATGFTTSHSAGNPNFGSSGFVMVGSLQAALNDFEGLGGNDTIIGNGNTRIVYFNATGGVTVNVSGYSASNAAFSGQVIGDASVGTDSFSEVSQISGTFFDDIFNGFANSVGNGPAEVFDPREGDDIVNGGLGFDIVAYSSAPSGGGITVTVINGGSSWDVLGGSNVGHDMLNGVETIRGTSEIDFFDADGFTGADTAVFGSNTFNEFEGFGGDDQIDGNGNTRITYQNASASVTVNMVTGQAVGASTGTDTFSGVSRVRGSNSNDLIIDNSGNNNLDGRGGLDTVSYANASAGVSISLASGGGQNNNAAGAGTDTLSQIENVIGSAFNDTLSGTDSVPNTNPSGNNVLTGGLGNDILDGLNGIDIAVFAGNRSAYTITGNNIAGPDGSDTVNGIELLQFDDGIYFFTSGGSVNISAVGFTNNLAIRGLVGNETLTVGSNINGRLIDLDSGSSDTVLLGSTFNAFYSLNVANVETITGGTFNDSVGFVSALNGTAVNLGAGGDFVFLANGSNTATFSGVENLNGGSGNDTLTFVGDGTTGQTINVGSGGTDTVTLAGTSSTFGLTLFGNMTVIGATTGAAAGVENVTLNNTVFGTTFDLGAGEDSLTLFGSPGFFNTITVKNVETVTGTAGIETIAIANDSGTTRVIGGANGDFLTASDANDIFRFNAASDSAGGTIDTVTNFNAAQDTFEFSSAAFAGFVPNYIGTSFFGGNDGEIRLNTNFGQNHLEIDLDGDTIADMDIMLMNHTGAFDNLNFQLV